MSSKITKVQLRTKLKAERQELSPDEVAQLSTAVTIRCLEIINWKGIRHLNVYSPIEKWRELDPNPLVTALKSGLPYLQVTTQPNKSSAATEDAQQYDAIIVPALGFDKHGYRLGMGGGFYDRFLAAQPKALKIGLGYEQGLIKRRLPAEPHDIPLDIIITEGIIINRESNTSKNR